MTSRVSLDNKDAVVLHHYDHRDSSLIVHFFLRDYGKVSAIARGVKKSKHNQSALLQPFQNLKVSLTGKNELLTLKSVESTNQNRQIMGKSLYCAYYLNELLLRLLPSHTDCQAIYELYQQVLELIAHNTDNDKLHFEAPLRLFELKLLEFLGYGLNLTYEIQSGVDIDPDKTYYYLIQSGPSEIKPDADFILVSGSTLIHLQKLQLGDQKTLQESKQLLKWALASHLGDKPLKSRELFKQLYCP